MNDDIAISVNNITKIYRLYPDRIDRVKEAFNPFKKKYHHPFNALSGVSYNVKKGETVGIIGRNGSGKSTLLQIICGILRPTSGKVKVAGKVSALLELGAGFNPEFTGRQNVYVNGAILGMSNEEMDKRFPEITAFADIGEYMDQPVKTYSSGMYVRLAFATAISVDPDILIIDEALAVGDTAFQAKCFAKFQEFQKKGVTILFVSHAMDMIMQYCSTAYLLEKGSIHACGNPKEVVDEYNRLIVNCARRTSVESIESDSTCDEPSRAEFVKGKQWEAGFQINPNENRYGNGKAEIIEAGIFTCDGNPSQTLMKGEPYEFRIKVRFNETVESPIFAYTIKDVKGFDVSGTNTLYQNMDIGVVHEGDVMVAVFRHKMALNPGGYLLSLGCTGFENGEFVIYERRYDYLVFEVVSKTFGVGIFDLDSVVTVSRI